MAAGTSVSVGSTESRQLYNTLHPIWDPGKDDFISLPPQVYSLMVALTQYSATPTQEEESRSELDSHANMPVVGCHATILADSGKDVDVSPFTPDYKSMMVRLVDAAVAYSCPYLGTTYIFVIQNTLYIPLMKINLLPPFILREKGIVVNNAPKIQVDAPTTQDHLLYFPKTKL